MEKDNIENEKATRRKNKRREIFNYLKPQTTDVFQFHLVSLSSTNESVFILHIYASFLHFTEKFQEMMMHCANEILPKTASPSDFVASDAVLCRVNGQNQSDSVDSGVCKNNNTEPRTNEKFDRITNIGMKTA